MKRKYLIGTILTSLALGGATTLIVQRVRAAGIPATGALTYTGYLEEPDGMPVAGPLAIGLKLFDADVDGTEVCEVTSASRELVAGRFQIDLGDDCTDAVSADPDLWVEVTVAGVALGRAKLGAVPYAVEAGRASAASGALEARIAALEARANVRSARVGSDGSETATWISGVTHTLNSGGYEIAFAANVFAATPACVLTPILGNAKSPSFECYNTSVNGMTCVSNISDVDVNSAPTYVDSGFSILGVEPK